MITSERFLARRGQAWPLMGAARPFARPRSTSCPRLKVPRRYTAGAESLRDRPANRRRGRSRQPSRPPSRVGGARGQCRRQRRKYAATSAASASGASSAAKWRRSSRTPFACGRWRVPDVRRPGDRGTPSHARVGPAEREPEDGEAIDAEEIRQLGDIRRPIRDSPPPLRIRSSDARPVHRDYARAGVLGGAFIRREVEPRARPAVKDEDRRAAAGTVLAVGEPSPVAQREHTVVVHRKPRL